jgi:hypothetical protein
VVAGLVPAIGVIGIFLRDDIYNFLRFEDKTKLLKTMQPPFIGTMDQIIEL